MDDVPYPAHHKGPRLIDWVLHQARLADQRLPEQTDYEPLIAEALRLFPKHTEAQARLLFEQAWQLKESNRPNDRDADDGRPVKIHYICMGANPDTTIH